MTSPSPPASLLLATDLTPRSDRALERSAQLANEWQAELTALHVLERASSPDQVLAWASGGDENALQAEAQLQASAYRRTYSESGVFDEAHFVEDDLSVVATAKGEYSIDTRIESRWKEIG